VRPRVDGRGCPQNGRLAVRNRQIVFLCIVVVFLVCLQFGPHVRFVLGFVRGAQGRVQGSLCARRPTPKIEIQDSQIGTRSESSSIFIFELVIEIVQIFRILLSISGFTVICINLAIISIASLRSCLARLAMV
jgi:hypothetical protein